MRRLLIGLVAALALVLPGASTEATWVDSAQASSSPIASLTLTAPTLVCATFGGTANVGWEISTVPTTLTYTATIVEKPSAVLTWVGTNLVTVPPAVLSTLLGQWVTLRVTGTLPGTSWTASSTIPIWVGLAGLTTSCTAPL